jgi:hypothetical protein
MCAHLSGARNDHKRFIVNGESRRFLNWSRVGLLKIGGKLTTERAKLAHRVGHLPGISLKERQATLEDVLPFDILNRTSKVP